MQADRDSAALVAWVLARLADVAAGRRPGEPEVSWGASGESIARLGERFGLDERERWAVGLAWAVAYSLDAARAARALSGARGLTVEVVREFLGLGASEVEELMAAEGRLRAHALLRVGAVPGGWPEATSEVALGAGLGPWLLPVSAGGLPRLGLGVDWIDPDKVRERPPLIDALAQLVRDDLVDVVARWVVVGGAQAGDATAIARALVWRLRRPCLVLDGQALGVLDFAARWELLAVARRESDLRDAPLLVDGTAALGQTWRALAARPAPGRHLPAPIVLMDPGSAGVLGGRPHSAFALREIQFAPTPTAHPTTPSAALAPAETTPAAPTAPAPEDPFEAVRRQAALDAARAMGRPIAIPREQLPARAVVPRALAEAAGGTSVPRPELAAPPPVASAPAETAPLSPAASTPAETAPPPPVASTPAAATPPPPVEARPKEPAAAPTAPTPLLLDPPAHPAAAQPATTPAASAVDEDVRPADETREAAATAPSSAPGVTSPDPAADPAEALPYIEVPEDAAVTDLLRLVPLAGNPLQRAELLRRLYSAKGNTQAAALLRAYTKSEHEAVRMAAEEGMTIFFGPNWNRSRAIPKPVQPPRSDDGGRGPHGAF